MWLQGLGLKDRTILTGSIGDPLGLVGPPDAEVVDGYSGQGSDHPHGGVERFRVKRHYQDEECEENEEDGNR